MEKDELIIKIVKIAREMGAADVGFFELSNSKEALASTYSEGITIVLRLSQGILSEIRDEPTINYFSHYRSVNRTIDAITLRILLFLEEEGIVGYSIPASQSDPKGNYRGVFPHKTGAVLSGLGFIGKSALFIHEDYGPAVRLGTILMKSHFGFHNQIMESQCGNCTRCRDLCPAQAIEGTLWHYGMEREMLLDARSCSTHMKKAYQHIGRGSVCGLCMVHCPYTQKSWRK